MYGVSATDEGIYLCIVCTGLGREKLCMGCRSVEKKLMDVITRSRRYRGGTPRAELIRNASSLLTSHLGTKPYQWHYCFSILVFEFRKLLSGVTFPIVYLNSSPKPITICQSMCLSALHVTFQSASSQHRSTSLISCKCFTPHSSRLRTVSFFRKIMTLAAVSPSCLKIDRQHKHSRKFILNQEILAKRF